MPNSLKSEPCDPAQKIACPTGTYSKSEAVRDSATFCEPCPLDATTRVAASASREDCLCNRGFYMDSMKLCQRCPLPGSDCGVAGSTIEVLFLEPGYWRMGTEYFDDSSGARRLQQEPYSDSSDVRACPDSKRDEDSACTGSSR